MSEIVRNGFCPHCSNIAPQRLLYVHTFEERRPYDDSFDFPTGDGPHHRYFVAACSTCNDILVYVSAYNPCPAEEFNKGEMVYPHGVGLHHSVPKTVRDCYDEAKRIQHNAPKAYVLTLRRALEAICEDKGVEKGSLKSRLDVLVTRGIMPPVLADMTWVLRTLGNASAHDATEIQVYTTWILDDFFKAIVEYVYVAPSRLADFQKEALRVESDAVH